MIVCMSENKPIKSNCCDNVLLSDMSLPLIIENPINPTTMYVHPETGYGSPGFMYQQRQLEDQRRREMADKIQKVKDCLCNVNTIKCLVFCCLSCIFGGTQ